MRVLVTGGAGFVGINTSLRFLNRGDDVTVFDNLSKTTQFVDVLTSSGAKMFHGDIREAEDVEAVMQNHYDVIFHLAAQVAVTTSLEDPVTDFKTNALGTLNLLEAMRKWNSKARLVFNSTNKVYGDLAGKQLADADKRYCLMGRSDATNEDEPLSFYSPYGCSKGCADQYIVDYGRIFGLDTVVLRCSCIAGQYQLGTEDQGWLAWFVLATLRNEPLNIYGTGKQVRDVVYVGDLVSLYEKLADAPNNYLEPVYNVGGGPDNTVSLLELIDMLEDITGKTVMYSLGAERPGDQMVFVSGNVNAEKLGWKPKVDVKTTVEKVMKFLKRIYEL